MQTAARLQQIQALEKTDPNVTMYVSYVAVTPLLITSNCPRQVLAGLMCSCVACLMCTLFACVNVGFCLCHMMDLVCVVQFGESSMCGFPVCAM